jgi:hypothetical protein
LKNAAGMGSLYLMFNLEYGSYTITDDINGKSITAGEYSFLHEFVDLTEAFGYTPTEITLHFSNGSVRLSEIYVFSPGTPPDFVQLWEPPLEGGADILLLATHGDDDQLYFAGLFPYYAGELKCRVQVAYMTDHRNGTYVRTHEMLNGLWETGELYFSSYSKLVGYSSIYYYDGEHTTELFKKCIQDCDFAQTQPVGIIHATPSGKDVWYFVSDGQLQLLEDPQIQDAVISPYGYRP